MDEGLLARARQVADCGPDAKPAPVRKTARTPAGGLRRLSEKTEGNFERFGVGDSVLLLPDKKNAIVYRPADGDGNVTVRFQGRKMTVRHNRLRLLVPASELYPPDYDFSVIFDTVANRKAAHTMERKYDPDAVIVLKEGKTEESCFCGDRRMSC